MPAIWQLGETMRRRRFVTLLASAVASPLAARAQAARQPIIGVLVFANPEPDLSLLHSGLRSLGYREGETITFELRVAGGSGAVMAEMAADLVTRKVDLIVAMTTPAVFAAKSATASIPIVMAGTADPVGSGLVASLARPGGNITGNSGALPEMAGKILDLLRELLPAGSQIAVLANAADPFHVRLIEGIELADRIVKADLRIYKISAPDIAATFEAMAADGIAAAIIQPTLPRGEVIAQALKHRLPTASPFRAYAEEGGLLSYGGHRVDQYNLAAVFVDKILKGAKPADLPVQQPTRFELVINAKTAWALGLEIPVRLLARADEVIE